MENLFDILWVNNSPIAKVIIGLILLIAFWAIKGIRSKNKKYSIELNAIKKAEGAFAKEKSKIAENINMKVPDIPLEHLVETIDFQEIIKVMDKNTFVYQRMKSLLLAKANKTNIDTDHEREKTILETTFDKNVIFPQYATSLCMMLGMLGTFYGLSVLVGDITSISNVSYQQSVDSILKATQDIQKVMGGVGTAFSTTLVGLFASIILNFYKYRSETKFHAFFKQLEDFISDKIYPLINASVSKDGKNIIRDISDNFEKTYSSITTTIKDNKESLQQLNGIYAKFKDIIEEVHKISRQNTNEQLSSVVGELTTVNQSMLQVVKQYDSRLEYINQLQKQNESQIRDYNQLANRSKNLPNLILGVIVILIILTLFIAGSIIYFFNYA